MALRLCKVLLLLGLGACKSPQVIAPAAPMLVVARAVPPAPPPVPPVVCTVRAAGPAPLRRLTREQYINTVSDLLTQPGQAAALSELRGVSVVASTTLPADEVVGPFRSNLVAAPTELDAQQIMEASERAADVAIKRFDTLYRCPAGDDIRTCARDFVGRMLTRAFRRVVHTDELSRYEQLFLQQAGPDNPRDGVRAVIRTLMQSPFVLNHTQGDGDVVSPGLVELGPYALASRLSYFLWMSGPDDALMAAAARGDLNTPQGLKAEAARLLRDDRAARAIGSFHLQWLGVEDVGSSPKNGKVFPLWNVARPEAGASKLGDALRKETERFVDHVIRKGDAKFETLMAASFSLLHDPLFEYYGVVKPAVFDPLVPVALDPTQRAGVLTQGSFLAFHAHAAQSSPVNRGVLIRRNILCDDLPDPPPNVNNTPPDPNAKLTTRERFEEHRLSGVCSGCHNLIDPIGFGFERYDGIGQYRATENGSPVDDSGSLAMSGKPGVAFKGAVELAHELANSRPARACYVKQWLRFAMGRQETFEDACSLRLLEDTFERNGHDIRSLLVTVTSTDAFRLRAIPLAKVTP